jgi:hypothetical protein
MSALFSFRRWSMVAMAVGLAVALVPSALPASPTPPVLCQRVPTSGVLLPGATASTPIEFSNQWQWSASSANQPFSWKLIRRDGVVVASGSSPGPGGSIFVPFNYYRWQVTNQGSVGQYWPRVCWSSGP